MELKGKSGRKSRIYASGLRRAERGPFLSGRGQKGAYQKRRNNALGPRIPSASLCQTAPRRRPYGSLGSSAIIPGANLFLSGSTGLFSLRSQRCRIRSFSVACSPAKLSGRKRSLVVSLKKDATPGSHLAETSLSSRRPHCSGRYVSPVFPFGRKTSPFLFRAPSGGARKSPRSLATMLTSAITRAFCVLRSTRLPRGSRAEN